MADCIMILYETIRDISCTKNDLNLLLFPVTSFFPVRQIFNVHTFKDPVNSDEAFR